MTGYDSSEDQRPLTYVNGHPIYATTLLVALHVLTLIATALVLGLGGGAILEVLSFSSDDAVSKGRLWQFFTYAFVNRIDVWFAIHLVLLFLYGREVEQYLGRRSFLKMYGLLLVLIPAALAAWGAFWPVHYSGSGALHFAVFVAFATIYPGMPLCFGITARWAATIFLAIYTLQAIAYHNIVLFLTVWTGSLVATLFVFHQRGTLRLPSLQFWKRQPKFHVVRESLDTGEEADAVESIDPLLEKISKSGLASLTRKERARLEKAREALMKKESPRR